MKNQSSHWMKISRKWGWLLYEALNSYWKPLSIQIKFLCEKMITCQLESSYLFPFSNVFKRQHMSFTISIFTGKLELKSTFSLFALPNYKLYSQLHENIALFEFLEFNQLFSFHLKIKWSKLQKVREKSILILTLLIFHQHFELFILILKTYWNHLWNGKVFFLHINE